ncbi:MAG: copper transporter [Actinomycetota bacterium]
MVDFRYHLVSIVAVLLALAIGLVLGSAILGGPFLERLDRRVGALEDDNERLEAEILEQDRIVDEGLAFQRSVEPHLVAGRLDGRRVTVFQFDGTEGDVVDAVRDEIELAGGAVSSTLTLTDRFALVDDVDRDQLALALGSAAAGKTELLAEAGRAIGAGAAAAGAKPLELGPDRPLQPEAFQDLLAELEEVGFIAIDGADPGTPPVPPDASFVVVGGSDDQAAIGIEALALGLIDGLSARGAAVVAVERSESAWGLVAAVRDDAAAREMASTVDHGETVTGRITVVLALAHASEDGAGHYGTAPGTTELLPAPPSAPAG